MQRYHGSFFSHFDKLEKPYSLRYLIHKRYNNVYVKINEHRSHGFSSPPPDDPLELNASCETITKSLGKHHQNYMNPCLGLPALGQKEFLSVAKAFGLDGVLDRWCVTGVVGWIAFELSPNNFRSSLNNSHVHTNEEPSDSGKQRGGFNNTKDSTTQSTQCINPNEHDSPILQREKVYRVSKIIPGGARFWDEADICWVTRQYSIHIHSATGTIILSRITPGQGKKKAKQFSQENREKKKYEFANGFQNKTNQQVPDDEVPLSSKEDLRNLMTVKALRFSRLVSVKRFCDIISQKHLLKIVCGALKCIRIARGSSLINSGFHGTPNGASQKKKKKKKRHVARRVARSVWMCLVQLCKTPRLMFTHERKNEDSFLKGSGKKTQTTVLDTIASSHSTGSSASFPSSSFPCSYMSSSSMFTPLRKPSQPLRMLTKTNWLQWLRQQIPVDDDNLFHEFGYNSVILTFSDMEFPLVFVFDEVLQAEQFTRFVTLLISWRS